MDLLRASVIVGALALAVAAASGLVVLAHSMNSRNIGLAVGSLLATAVFIGYTMYTELRTTERTESFWTDLPVDREGRTIDQSLRSRVVPIHKSLFHDRMSAWLTSSGMAIGTTQAPEDFKSAPDAQLATDALIRSVVAFLEYGLVNWTTELEQVSPRGVYTRTYPGPTKECTVFTHEDLQERLRGARNRFADVPALEPNLGPLCLPVRTQLHVGESYVQITTPYNQVTISFNDLGERDYRQPGTESAPQLADGPRFVRHIRQVRVHELVFALRSQDRDLPRYRAFADRVMREVRVWLDPL